MTRANVDRDAGDFAAAHACYELSLAHEAEAVSIRADILHNAGQLAFYESQVGQARALHEDALAIRRRLAQPREIGLSLAWLGRALDALGDRAQAGALYAESVPLHRLTGSHWGQAVTLEGLASLVASDHPADALPLAGAADRLRDDMGRAVPAAAADPRAVAGSCAATAIDPTPSDRRQLHRNLGRGRLVKRPDRKQGRRDYRREAGPSLEVHTDTDWMRHV